MKVRSVPPSRTRPATAPAPPRPAERFRDQDEYRVDREWRRYEGNALRDLFRSLRVRFLERNPAATPGPVLEIGPGPGRFSPHLGDPQHPRVLLDLSVRALRVARGHLSGRSISSVGSSEFVRGDARSLPFREHRFSQCVLMGNAIGFAGADGLRMLRSVGALLEPGGSLLFEAVAGSGESSAYLRRLPPGTVRRVLAAPVAAVLPRVEREGFPSQPERKRETSEFRRYSADELRGFLDGNGFEVQEMGAVAPALGALPDRVELVRSDPRAWSRLLELEESLGRRPERLAHAAALLVSARRRPEPDRRVK